MWNLLLQTAPGDLNFVNSLVAYGVAAPLIILLFWAWRKAMSERDEERKRVDVLTERLIKQHEDLLPVTRDLLQFMERWERSL